MLTNICRKDSHAKIKICLEKWVLIKLTHPIISSHYVAIQDIDHDVAFCPGFFAIVFVFEKLIVVPTADISRTSHEEYWTWSI